MRCNVLGCAFALAVALSSACSSSSNSRFTPTSDDGGAGDNGSDATSSGNNPNPSDAGPHCGAQACGASEVCCYGNAAMPTCMASGACQGSFLACTSQGDCSGGEACCFAYAQTGTADEGGPPTGRGGGPPGLGGSFTAQCQGSCDTGSYQLCASDAECQTGETCGMGPYAEYCQTNPFGDGGFPIRPPNNVPDQ